MAGQTTCPVCVTPAGVTMNILWVDIGCPRCGKFSLFRTVFDDLPELLGRPPYPAVPQPRSALMSHTIRRMQREGSSIQIQPQQVASYWNRDRLPTPTEQAEDLILWIGENQPNPMLFAEAPELLLDAWIGAALPQLAGSPSGLRWLLQQIEPEGRTPNLFIHAITHANRRFQLTMAGWERYGTLKRARNESRSAFMAMKFGDAELNEVVGTCFRPAVKRAGFELRDLQDHKRAGLIDDQIRAGLLAARFVVADLTHDSFGAYWEAGFADGRGLPVIYTCKRARWQNAKSHFDTNHMATVLWDVGDPKSAEDELVSIIRTTLRADAKQNDD